MDRKMTEAEKKLVEDNLGLIRGYCKLYRLDYEKFYDILALKMCEVACNYDPEKGSPSTYFYKAFRTAVYREYLDTTRLKRINDWEVLSLDYDYHNGEDRNDESHLMDLISSGYNMEEDIVNKCFVNDILDYVKRITKPMYYEWFIKRYVDRLTLQEIGDQYGVTREAIRAVTQRLSDKVNIRFGSYL